MRSVTLEESLWEDITEILDRRANDVASFKMDMETELGRKLNGFPGSVEMALSREVYRLRKLSTALKPPFEEEEE